MDSPITFGVELEFLCVYRKDAFANYVFGIENVDEEQKAAYAIYCYLQKFGISSTGFEDLGSQNDEESYSRWRVDSDNLALTPEEKAVLPAGYVVEAIELSSRILTLNTISEISKVLDVLKWLRDHLPVGFYVNDSCGLHVHVGRSDQPVALHTAKRVFQLQTAHERLFDGLHAANRITMPIHSQDPVNNYPAPSFAPLSFWHNCIDETDDTNVFDRVQRIEQMVDIRAVAEYFELYYDRTLLSGHNASVNFDNLGPTVEEPKNTIEFRQAAGTLDAKEICYYVILYTSIFHWCETVSNAAFAQMLTSSLDTDFNLAHLLTAMQVPQEVVLYFSNPREPHSNVLGRGDLDTLSIVNQSRAWELKRQAAIEELVGEKWEECYYGNDPTAGKIPLSDMSIKTMLDAAFLSRNRHPACRCGGNQCSFKCVQQEGMAAFWGKMANIYRNLDSSLGEDQAAVRDELLEWQHVWF